MKDLIAVAPARELDSTLAFARDLDVSLKDLSIGFAHAPTFVQEDLH